MSNKIYLRIFIILGLLFYISSIVLSFKLKGSLPLVLQEFLADKTYNFISPMMALSLLLICILTFISLLLLFFYIEWSKWLYTISIFALFVFCYLSKPPVVSPVLVVTLCESGILCFGIIFGLIFFTDIFENK
jgi:hypothetical protein